MSNFERFRVTEVELALWEERQAKARRAMTEEERQAHDESVEAEEVLRAFEVTGASQ